jgi:hypothetical protein
MNAAQGTRYEQNIDRRLEYEKSSAMSNYKWPHAPLST